MVTIRLLFFVIMFVPGVIPAQNFTFTPLNGLTLHGTPGDLVIFDADIHNTSQQPLSIRIRRMQENLPSGWTSSLCSGALCFPPDRDEYTLPDTIFGFPPLAPDSVEEFHLNVNTGPSPGVGDVVIRVENMNNPSEFIELTFTASTQPTAIDPVNDPVTGNFRLLKNYPNPFNPSTTIPFEIGGKRPAPVVLEVFNMLGERVNVLVNERLQPGVYEVAWNATDFNGTPLPSGIYFYQLKAADFRQTGKMALLR